MIFILLASISEVTNHHLFQWDIGKQLNYLGYYIIGYTIRTNVGEKKNNFKGIMLIFIGLLSLTVMAIIKFFEMQHGKVLHLGGIEIFGWNYMTPLEIIGSLFVFWGFSTLDLKKDFSRLASYTFLIYLIHAFVWGIMHNTVMNFIYPKAHAAMVLPTAAIAG